MKLRILVENYKAFLELCWVKIHQLIPPDRKEELLADWLQYHWELLVEQPLREENPSLFLEFYGDGSENENGRVFMPSAKATHRLCFRPFEGNYLEDLIEGKTVKFSRSGLPADRFVSCQKGEWFREEPPFNAVLGTCSTPNTFGSALVFPIDNLEFFLEPVM